MVPVGMVPVGVGQVPPEGLGGLGSVSPPQCSSRHTTYFLGNLLIFWVCFPILGWETCHESFWEQKEHCNARKIIINILLTAN